VEFTWKQDKIECALDNSVLYIKGELTFLNAAAFIDAMELNLSEYSEGQLVIDLEQLNYIDSAGVTVIYHLIEKARGWNINVHLKSHQKKVEEKFQIFKPAEAHESKTKTKQGFFEKIGDRAIFIYKNHIFVYLLLMSEVFYWSFNDLFYRKARRKGEFLNQAVLIGVNAILIVGVMSFIIGLVLALQSAAQLRNFGANIYIVDLTVIAMMREMGPLITAILVAGRSGSAIAAEIATMKVTSEIDALTTMGLNPIRFVVVPKMYGSLVTMPFLTIFASIMGILGGMLVAFLYLDITPVVFFGRMGESLFNKDILFGFLKSIVFAGIIVLTGSYFGFHVDKGAEGVGRVTTSSVVVSISLVIVADSILGIVFY
jgi:phospholipid/cholesterol/gamma-HCH transport system permease protein